MKTVTNYESVKTELQQRGMWDVLHEGHLPNRTLAYKESREIFYVQDEPKLAAWGQYDTDEDFFEVLNNVTTKRLTPDSTMEVQTNPIV